TASLRSPMPAIHALLTYFEFQQTWMPGTSPGMTVLSELPSSTTLSGHRSLVRDPARRLDKGADHRGVLVTRRTLHTGGNIDATGTRHANRFSDIAGVQPTRDHVGYRK